MNTADPRIQFLGEQPDIVGHVCTGLAVQHFYDGKSLADQANVTYLCFAGTWHRVHFETGTVFWRSGQAPEQPVNSTLEHGLLLNDLSELPSVAGRTLIGIDYAATEAGDVAARFNFDGDAVVHLRYSAATDSTQIDV